MVLFPKAPPTLFLVVLSHEASVVDQLAASDPWSQSGGISKLEYVAYYRAATPKGAY